MKKIILSLLFFVLLSVSVFSQPTPPVCEVDFSEANIPFVSTVAFVDLVEKVKSVDRVESDLFHVLGTEYVPFQNGTIFLDIIDVSSVNDTICEIQIFYPDKTLFVDGIMSYLNFTKATYFFDFVVPDVDGVFITEVVCNNPLGSGDRKTYYGRLNSQYVLTNNSDAVGYYDFGSIPLNSVVCAESFLYFPDAFPESNLLRFMSNITNHTIYLSAGNVRSVNVHVNFSIYNVLTLDNVNFNSSVFPINISTVPSGFVVPDVDVNSFFTSNDRLRVDVCIENLGGLQPAKFHYGGSYPSQMNRHFLAVNVSENIEYRGTGEIHVSKFNNVDFSSLFDRFDFVNALVLSSFTNISSLLSVHDSDIKSLLSNIDSDISSLSSQCSANYNLLDDRISVLDDKLDLLLEKFSVVTDNINLDAQTFDCLEGTNWMIEVTATDNFGNYLSEDNINCNITTNLWGTASLVWDGDSFDYEHLCIYANQTIGWGVECEEN